MDSASSRWTAPSIQPHPARPHLRFLSEHGQIGKAAPAKNRTAARHSIWGKAVKLLASLVVGVALGGSAVAQTVTCPTDEATLRTDLQVRSDAWMAAVESRSAANIQPFLSPDFQILDILGRSRDATTSMRDESELPIDPTRINKTTLLTIKIVGSATVVQQRLETQSVNTTTAGDNHLVSMTILSTDRWICSDAVWLLQRKEIDQVDVSVDGQPVAHKVRGSGP
jgi:hypothetical protein